MTHEATGKPISSAKAGWSVGISTGAAILLLMAGTFQFLAGLAALINDQLFVLTPNYAFTFDVTTWGWIHLIIGIVAFAAGCGLLVAATWARVLGIVIAAVGAVGSFMWLPQEPWWSTILILLYVAIIWALAVLGDAARRPVVS